MQVHSHRQFRLRCQYGCSCINLPWTRRFERDGKTFQTGGAGMGAAPQGRAARACARGNGAETGRAAAAGLNGRARPGCGHSNSSARFCLLNTISRGCSIGSSARGSSSVRRALKTGGATFCALARAGSRCATRCGRFMGRRSNPLWEAASTRRKWGRCPHSSRASSMAQRRLNRTANDHSQCGAFESRTWN